MGEEGREGEKGMMIKFDSHSTTTTYIRTSMMMVGDSTRFELCGTVSLRLIAGWDVHILLAQAYVGVCVSI